MQLYVWDGTMTQKYAADIKSATADDFQNTTAWQTHWTTPAIAAMPNKVALHRTETGELLGLMSYDLDRNGLAVEIIYMESAGHSNANLLHRKGERRLQKMDKQKIEYFRSIEQHGAENGWVAATTAEDRSYLAYFRAVCKRYNIIPSKATRLEYEFVTRVTDSEFYLQQANA